MELPDRIQILPDVMMGKPCIRGTRIPVYLLLEKLGAGETMEDLLEVYPQLTREDFAACFSYAATLAAEEVILVDA